MRSVFDIRNPVQFHMDWPTGAQQGGNTIRYVGWVESASVMQSIRVLATTPNTVGTYTLQVTNLENSQQCISGTTFNMNSISANTVAGVTLDQTNGSLTFAKKGRFQIDLVSNDGGFDGLGTHLSIFFRES